MFHCAKCESNLAAHRVEKEIQNLLFLSSMPCGCRIPGPSYPENGEWGPYAWTILHALAEKTTRIVYPLYENDERRAWIELLKATGPMLPCEECRGHYQTWLEAHPVTSIKTMPYSQLREWIRTWLWTLHEDVNRRLEKASFAYADLTNKYGSGSISWTFKTFELVEKRAIEQQGVNLKAWLEWVKHYRTLTSVYGIT